MNFEHLSAGKKFFSLLLVWRNFILYSFLFVLITSIGFSFLIENKYKSSAVLMVPEGNKGLGIGAISSLVSSSLPSIGSKLLGGDSNTDRMIGILESRLLHEMLISEFDLIEYYEKDENKDLTLKAFRQEYIVDLNQNLMIELSYTHKKPEVAAALVNRSVVILDSLNREFAAQEAYQNRKYIEQRYTKNILELKRSEDSLTTFQKKYGVLAVDEQIKAMIVSVAELEVDLLKRELLLAATERTLGINSNQYQTEKQIIDQLKSKINSLRNDTKPEFSSIFMIPVKTAPDIGIKYFRFLREIEIQSRILQVTLPIYEQALMEENKNIPTIITLDSAREATYKDSPKRLVIVLIISFIWFFASISIVYLFYFSLIESDDSIFNGTKKISAKIATFFRVTY